MKKIDAGKLISWVFVVSAAGAVCAETVDFNTRSDFKRFSYSDALQYRIKGRGGIGNSGSLVVGARANSGGSYDALPVTLKDAGDRVEISIDFKWIDTNGNNKQPFLVLRIGFVSMQGADFTRNSTDLLGYIGFFLSPNQKVQIQTMVGTTVVKGKEEALLTEGMWYRLTGTFTLTDPDSNKVNILSKIEGIGAGGLEPPTLVLSNQDVRRMPNLIGKTVYTGFSAALGWLGGGEYLDNYSVTVEMK